MLTIQTDLVIIGAHTLQPTIMWKGQTVPQVTGLKVISGVVTLAISEDPVLAEMQQAGIRIVRGSI